MLAAFEQLYQQALVHLERVRGQKEDVEAEMNEEARDHVSETTGTLSTPMENSEVEEIEVADSEPAEQTSEIEEPAHVRKPSAASDTKAVELQATEVKKKKKSADVSGGGERGRHRGRRQDLPTSSSPGDLEEQRQSRSPVKQKEEDSAKRSKSAEISRNEEPPTPARAKKKIRINDTPPPAPTVPSHPPKHQKFSQDQAKGSKKVAPKPILKPSSNAKKPKETNMPSFFSDILERDEPSLQRSSDRRPPASKANQPPQSKSWFQNRLPERSSQALAGNDDEEDAGEDDFVWHMLFPELAGK